MTFVITAIVASFSLLAVYTGPLLDWLEGTNSNDGSPRAGIGVTPKSVAREITLHNAAVAGLNNVFGQVEYERNLYSIRG